MGESLRRHQVVEGAKAYLQASHAFPQDDEGNETFLERLRSLIAGRGPLITEKERYLNREKINDGANGTVFRARDSIGERDVALKIYDNWTTTSTAVCGGFLNEIRFQAPALEGAVRVYDFGCDKNDRPYLVMELAEEGWPEIADRFISLASQNNDAGLMDEARRMAEPLASIHRQGIIHRDVKNFNIVRLKGGDYRLVDFALTVREKETGQMDPRDHATGTPYFMPPECSGPGARTTLSRDVYGWGSSLKYLWLRPLSPNCEGSPIPLRPILERCLDPDPGKRFRNGIELLDALRAW